MNASAQATETHGTFRATLRPYLPVLVAGGLAGVLWGVVWPFMKSAGVL